MSSPFDYNGGTVVAMTGAGCVCIASDLRLGVQFETILTNKPKIYKMSDYLYFGATGLATDCQTVVERLQFRKNLYELRENRPMKPSTFANMLSNLLYEHRFGPYFLSPIVAGLNPITWQPYIAGTDSIGCLSSPKDFVFAGTASDELAALCEASWEKNMDKDTLFETTAQCLLGAMDRNASSGWGAVVYTISKEGATAKTIKARID